MGFFFWVRLHSAAPFSPCLKPVPALSQPCSSPDLCTAPRPLPALLWLSWRLRDCGVKDVSCTQATLACTEMSKTLEEGTPSCCPPSACSSRGDIQCPDSLGCSASPRWPQPGWEGMCKHLEVLESKSTSSAPCSQSAPHPQGHTGLPLPLETFVPSPLLRTPPIPTLFQNSHTGTKNPRQMWGFWKRIAAVRAGCTSCRRNVLITISQVMLSSCCWTHHVKFQLTPRQIEAQHILSSCSVPVVVFFFIQSNKTGTKLHFAAYGKIWSNQ